MTASKIDSVADHALPPAVFDEAASPFGSVKSQNPKKTTRTAMSSFFMGHFPTKGG